MIARGVPRGRVVRGADRFPEIGERAIDREIEGGIVAQETQILADISGNKDQPDAEKRRRYDPTPHARV